MKFKENCCIECVNPRECALCLQFFDYCGIRWANSGHRTVDSPLYFNNGNTCYVIRNNKLTFARTPIRGLHHFSFNGFLKANGLNVTVTVLLRKMMCGELLEIYKKFKYDRNQWQIL